MKTIIATVGALIAALFISCCVAVGPFELPDGKFELPLTSVIAPVIKAAFIWEEVILVSEKTFRRVYRRDIALL